MIVSHFVPHTPGHPHEVKCISFFSKMQKEQAYFFKKHNAKLFKTSLPYLCIFFIQNNMPHVK